MRQYNPVRKFGLFVGRQSEKFIRLLKLVVMWIVVFPRSASAQAGQISSKIDNPLGPTITTLPVFIAKILDIVVLVGLPIAVFFIIYSGFLLVMAQGDPKKLETGKLAFLYSVIGTAILIVAKIISAAIFATIDSLK